MGKATVAIEDRRFYEHGGVDFRGIARAAVQRRPGRPHASRAAPRSRSSSCATSTSATRSERLHRKLVEACLAIKLSRRAREELDPRQLHEHGLLRQPCVRRRGGRADVLLAPREQALAPPVGSARRAAAGPVDLRPVQEPRARARAAQRRAEGAVRERRHQLRQLPGGDPGHRPAPAPGQDLHAGSASPTSSATCATSCQGDTAPRRFARAGSRSTRPSTARMQRAATTAIKDTLYYDTDPASAIVAIDPRTRRDQDDDRGHARTVGQPVQPRCTGTPPGRLDLQDLRPDAGRRPRASTRTRRRYVSAPLHYQPNPNVAGLGRLAPTRTRTSARRRSRTRRCSRTTPSTRG